MGLGGLGREESGNPRDVWVWECWF
jgi:hypothetical protein